MKNSPIVHIQVFMFDQIRYVSFCFSTGNTITNGKYLTTEIQDDKVNKFIKPKILAVNRH